LNSIKLGQEGEDC